MARLQYQPVVAPQVGNAAAAVNDAARNVTAGLAALGTGLTNLGERQEKRVELANQKREAQIKNTIAMYAQMAPDEAALQSLMGDVTNYVSQPGAAPDAPASIMDKVLGRGSVSPTALGADVDFASMFSDRRNNMLVDESTRAGIRSTDASTAGQLTENAIKNLELEDKNLENAWNTEFGADLNRAASLAAEGKIDEARAIESEVLLKAGSRYGARPDEFFKRSFDLLTAGDDARSGVTKNALDIEGAKLGNTLTSEQILGERQDRSIAASQETDRARLANVDWKLKSKELDALLASDVTKDRMATIVENSYGLDHAIELVELETDLTPAQRNTMKLAITKQAKADPTFFETMNPSKTQFSYDKGINPNRVVADVFATIQSRKRGNDPDGANKGLPSAAIYEKANAFDRQNAGSPDVAATIEERFSALKIDEGDRAWLFRVRDGEFGNRALTNGELLAIVEEGYGTKGWFRNKVGFDRNEIKDIAKKYGEMDPAALAAQNDRYERDASTAMRLESRVKAIEFEIVRATDAKDTSKVNALTEELNTITADLTGILLSYKPAKDQKKTEAKPAGKAAVSDGKPPKSGNLSRGPSDTAFPTSDSDIIPRRGY